MSRESWDIFFDMQGYLKLCRKLFGSNIKKITIEDLKIVNKFKIVVFVPDKNADLIAKAMSDAGAGKIGNYENCSFRLKGTGTFLGNKLSNPSRGDAGKLVKVSEIRVEMLCDEKNLENAVKQMLLIHPYEEPAYEIYPVLSGVSGKTYLNVELKKPVSVHAVLKKSGRSVNKELLKNNQLINRAVISNKEVTKRFKTKTLYIKKLQSSIKLKVA